MLLTLLDKNNSLDFILPQKISGKYIIKTIDKNKKKVPLIAIEEEEGKWFLKSNKNAYLNDSNNEKISKLELQPSNVYRINRIGEEPAILCTQRPTKGTYEYTKYVVKQSLINIGRGKQNQICYPDKLVSVGHCYITYDSMGNGTIVDNNSSNGTYVNGIKIKEKLLSNGDAIYIMGLKIIYNGRLIGINNPDNLVEISEFALEEFKQEEPEMACEEEFDDFDIKDEDNDVFYRSPRFKRDIERVNFTIDSPPSRGNKNEMPIIFMLGPAMTMGMASLFTGMVTLNNVLRSGNDVMTAMPTLIMSFSMLLGTVLWPVLSKRYEKRKNKEAEEVRQRRYKEYLSQIRQDINIEAEKQIEILYENNISPEECIARIQNHERNLWERTNNHNDFLKVRLGIGDMPLDAEIKTQGKKFTVEEDNLLEELYKLLDEPKVLHDVPITLSFLEEKVCGIIGEREMTKALLKSIILQLMALHGYDELKLIFIYDDEEEKDWSFTKWLPHTWKGDKSIRFIGTNAQDVKELSSEIEKEIIYRSSLSNEEIDEEIPRFVIFSLSKTLGNKAEFIKTILEEKKDLGFRIVTLYDELKNLPKECTKVIEINQGMSKIYDKYDISGRYTEFKVDILSADIMEEVAIDLANIKLDTLTNSFVLPETLTFLEMFKVSKIEHLNILERWKENNPTKALETEIGVDTMGEAFKLDLHEKFHGPHGLIAGMTGSGKSEFIMTFILSLAVNYHPDEVAFILIDYKGGGMANTFTNLPHLAGTITNLDGAAVKRSLISIQSELKRRQGIFSETSKNLGVSNIDIYKYQKLYREGKVFEPLQHLFIISDEFAELKTSQPEFMEQLVSAARIGRSLGVHLILATQKPSGIVDDQIWSNSRFRISLKVQEISDSMDVIKRPDAAKLSTTGRFYLQVGFNELFEMGQSAWSGAPYYPSDKIEIEKNEEIQVIDKLGRVMKSLKLNKRTEVSSNPPKQIDEIVKFISDIAKEEKLKVKPLWLEPIAELIYIDELKKKYHIPKSKEFLLEPVIGEYDDPTNQSQHIMTLPLSREGNVILYGSAGNGKTTFLTSLIYSLMEEHTPEELNMYILDFASETLRSFKKAPHVGDVLLSYHSEKINNLFKMLYVEIKKRKKLFSDYGGDYNSYIRNSGKKIESILVIIHNFAAFTEGYGEKEEDVSYLTREGTKYGIYFVITALNTSSVRYRLVQNFKQLLVLQLNDEAEYSAVLGHTSGVVPSKFKGRGIFKLGKTYEFQTAHIFKDIENTFDLVRAYCNNYSEMWTKDCAKKIPILPEKVDAKYLLHEIKSVRGNKVPIGVEKSSLKVNCYDFNSKFISLVLTESIRETSFAQGLAEVMTKYDEDIIVVDGGQSFIGEEKNYKYISNVSEFEEIAVELFNILVERHNTIKAAKESGRDIPVYRKIKCIINSFGDFMKYLSEDGKDKVRVFLENGQETYNINFVIVDTPKIISEFTYEPWFKKHISLNDGVWIGNGITNQYQFKIARFTNDMYEEIGNEFGYAINQGKVKLIKLVSSIDLEEE
ncbi:MULTISPECIES: type VII secretion protein EssC [Clostridium]|uniref:Type VII secretion protein EssC n=1 Tax=Clostridium cibarium TaxID=2762247 RepID=A0ABR8PPU4_9CLOT|nr:MULTISPECIES: type VII secretion protein EssC [Clostridium]MBD7910192.1 type VII secretion protein EssC [Clostridium cibarium]